MNVLQVYDKLEKLVARLPVPLQKPILHEITPIKNLFLLRRPPRLVLLGESNPAKAAVINSLFGAAIVPAGDEPSGPIGWHDLKGKRGVLRILDARPPAPLTAVGNALAAEPADVFLFLRSAAGIQGAAPCDFAYAGEVADSTRGAEPQPGLIGILATNGEHPGAERNDFQASVHANPSLGERLRGAFCVPAGPLFDDAGVLTPDARAALEPLGEALLMELPENARLEMARLSGVRSVQRRLAQVLINAAVAISSAIGAQPIPLADLPILLSIQVSLVSGIMYVSGRELSARLAGEFIAAVGANFGAGIALRETSRALLKFFPGWGNAISGAIAGAGTFAIGKSASAYFIDGISFKEARRLFKRTKEKAVEQGSTT